MGSAFRGRIVIAGGSGQLGRILGRWLAARGSEVVALTRSTPYADGIPGRAGIRACAWDGRTLGTWTAELNGAAAVINLAGRSVNCRYTGRNRRKMMESRIASTRVIGEAIARCDTPPPVWLNSSTATIYRHTYGPAWDEAGEIGATREAKDSFSVEIARAWEKEFFADLPTRAPVRKVALRTAIVLAGEPENMVGILRRLARWGLGGPMGDGRQYVSWIHEMDFCRAVEYLLEHPEIEGVANIAAPRPVTNAEMMRIVREIEGRRFGLPATRWMLEIGAFVLRTETELIIKSRRVIPGKLLAAGFRWDFPEMFGAMREIAGRVDQRAAAEDRIGRQMPSVPRSSAG